LLATIIGRKHKGQWGHTLLKRKKKKKKQKKNLDLNPRYILAFQLGLA
jgi:hypothetical protein